MSSNSTYFNKFPKINFNNKLCVDLFTSISFNDKTIIDDIKTEPFILEDSDNAEELSNFLYQDPYYFYILLLVNNIINPYDWIVNNNEFNRIIIDKYQTQFLTLHKSRVISQLHDFFEQFYTFSISLKLPMGKYYVRIKYNDIKAVGRLKLNINTENYNSAVSTINNSYSNLLFDYSLVKTFTNDLYLIDNPSSLTKIFLIHPNNNVNLDLNIKQFIPFICQSDLENVQERVDTFPYYKEFTIERSQSVILEIEVNQVDKFLSLFGEITDASIELFNSSTLLIYKTYSGQEVDQKLFALSFTEKFVLEKRYSQENDLLYLYSTNLIKSLFRIIYNNQQQTQFINFSLLTFKQFILDNYDKQFAPIMYDDLISSSFKSTKDNNSSSSSSINEYNKQNIIKIRCASNFNINIKKIPSSIDNVILTTQCLVLIKDQDIPSENGIYTINSKGFFVKDTTIKLIIMMVLFVEQGSKNKQTEWVLTRKTTNMQLKLPEYYFSQNSGIINSNSNQQTSNLILNYINNLAESENYHYYAYDIYNETHHWETLSTSSLGKDIIIDEEYTDEFPLNEIYKTRISNFEYESIANNNKKTINVLKPKFLETYMTQFHSLLDEQTEK